jgi:hypothetical protein
MSRRPVPACGSAQKLLDGGREVVKRWAADSVQGQAPSDLSKGQSTTTAHRSIARPVSTRVWMVMNHHFPAPSPITAQLRSTIVKHEPSVELRQHRWPRFAGAVMRLSGAGKLIFQVPFQKSVHNLLVKLAFGWESRPPATPCWRRRRHTGQPRCLPVCDGQEGDTFGW